MTLKFTGFALVFTATACAVAPPTGPGVLVLPGTGKSFEQFRYDDNLCRQYAFSQIGGVSPAQAGSASGVNTALTGTAIGAAAGAAFGGGEGAAIGAGSGLLAGSLSGTHAAAMSGYEAQQRYDMSYIQCMYAQGNRVPVSGNFVDENRAPTGGQQPGYQTPLPPDALLPPPN